MWFNFLSILSYSAISGYHQQASGATTYGCIHVLAGFGPLMVEQEGFLVAPICHFIIELLTSTVRF